VTNSHLIDGDVFLGEGNYTVVNSGTITGQVYGSFLGVGNNTLVNSGTIREIGGTSGRDVVTNFAIVGDVMKSGTVLGTIALGDGNDTLIGGANAESDVQDGNGADNYRLGGGNDTYFASYFNNTADGIDTVKGGAGIDTYQAGNAFSDVTINLDAIVHGGVAANTATGTDIAGTAKDMIFGFENATGGFGSDIIYGSAAGNVLVGGGGNDFLLGFGGNDTLDDSIGFGNDLLAGGAGKDTLTGGAGQDLFFYAKLSDSTAATCDLIADFEQGSDVIALSAIDANTTNAAGTNDDFTFIGTNVAFTGTPGQLHAFWSAIGQIIEGDVNGDAKADLSIEIQDPTHAITLTSSSFAL
jgi:serralysin